MNLMDVQTAAWRAAVTTDLPFNPDAAFEKEWLTRKAGYSGPLGVPVTGEIAVAEGGTAQAFSCGVVLHWTDAGLEVL